MNKFKDTNEAFAQGRGFWCLLVAAKDTGEALTCAEFRPDCRAQTFSNGPPHNTFSLCSPAAMVGVVDQSPGRDWRTLAHRYSWLTTRRTKSPEEETRQSANSGNRSRSHHAFG